ncbi:uncharacterized protein IWZ02DRAFT_491844 [Phyllosticta citriasiana]|uniref:uncharacterized protein n=1 Tax=Phyllosticta citriasiana TaxID=595635 RepID=UPI0030FDD7E8
MAADYAATKESAEHWQFNDTKQLRIRPLVFSDAKSDRVYHENRSDQHGLGVGTILPVVFWTLRFFGPEEYIATRSLAAMSLLRDVFGKQPRSMAIMLQDVDPGILKSILEHEWVRRNFAVGFDHTPIKFDGWGHVYTPVSSVMMVSKQLRTANWILVNELLSVDLPIDCHDRVQNVENLLKLVTASLSVAQKLSKGDLNSIRKWTHPDLREKKMDIVIRSTDPKFQRKRSEEIKKFMKSGIRPKDKIVAAVFGLELFTDKSGRRRSAYKWQKMGAASLPQDTENVRTGRLVQIRHPNPDDLEELEELNDNTRKNGINSKVSLGTFPKGKLPLIPAHSDITSNTTPWRHWPHREVFMWVSDDYGIAKGVKVQLPVTDWRFQAHVRKIQITDNKPGKDKNFSGVV